MPVPDGEAMSLDSNALAAGRERLRGAPLVTRDATLYRPVAVNTALPNPDLHRMNPRLLLATALAAVTLTACTDRNEPCPECGTVVIAATGEPAAIFPPLVWEAVGRDIGDLVWERLAELEPRAAPLDAGAYRPGLAVRWERVDSTGWRFHLRPGARWHDGRPVSAADVVFSFESYGDSAVDAAARTQLAGVRAEATDSMTVVVRFDRAYPEQLYDATQHVRVVPSHLWSGRPRGEWAADTSTSRLVGSGPYRVVQWRRGEHLTLAADSGAAGETAPQRVLWRFTADPDAALNLVLSREADLLENVGTPERRARVAADTALRVIEYPSAVYGFLGFNLGPGSPARAVLGDRAVRRALTLAADREAYASAVFGEGTRVPAGPMSELLWIGREGVTTLPFDTAAAARLLDSAGWRRPSNGATRRRAGVPLRLDVIVPASSPPRRQLAVILQEAWRSVGVEATVTAVDFAVFQERLMEGRFDAYIGAYLDEPSPRGLADQWGRAGWNALNYGKWAHPGFDSLLAAAGATSDMERARRLYREAMDTINADAPAIFLYTPVQAAVAHRRLDRVEIDPYSWLSGLPEWRITGAR